MIERAALADSCRLALPAEAERIAAVQRRSWAQLFPSDVADHVLASVDLATMAASWQAAILRPPLATFRVMVALSEGRVVAFAAIGPSDDEDAHPGEDALVAEFVVDPPAQRQGHGSRLLNAVADTLRADGFTRATWWVRSTDDPLRRFLVSAGWGPDGAHRTVGSEDAAATVKMIRMHTALG
ncbi:MAG: GNAT family N-acetyltransferase [Propioniciclava sp.]|uniref:GNAT family N-acetyltransferase n=1 Tax=Propioniciclava sp. TaxID=2038686 RepID=UPI0039E69C68